MEEGSRHAAIATSMLRRSASSGFRQGLRNSSVILPLGPCGASVEMPEFGAEGQGRAQTCSGHTTD